MPLPAKIMIARVDDEEDNYEDEIACLPFPFPFDVPFPFPLVAGVAAPAPAAPAPAAVVAIAVAGVAFVVAVVAFVVPAIERRNVFAMESISSCVRGLFRSGCYGCVWVVVSIKLSHLPEGDLTACQTHVVTLPSSLARWSVFPSSVVNQPALPEPLLPLRRLMLLLLLLPRQCRRRRRRRGRGRGRGRRRSHDCLFDEAHPAIEKDELGLDRSAQALH